MTADVLALTTGFVVTLDDPAMDSMTVMRSVESRATDLNRIHAVNQLSRDFCEGNIDLDGSGRSEEHTSPPRFPAGFLPP